MERHLGRSADDAGHAAKLGVDLKRHVGDVLGTGLAGHVADAGGLHHNALRGHPKPHVRLELHLLVELDVLLGQHHEDELARVVLGLHDGSLGRLHEALDGLPGAVLVYHHGGLLYCHAAHFQHRHEVVEEAIQRGAFPFPRRLHRGPVGEHDYGPVLQRLGLVELGVDEVPRPPVRLDGAAATVRHDRGRENPPFHLEHLRVHLHAEGLNGGLGGEAEQLNVLLHALDPFHRHLAGVLDDRCRLHCVQLALALPGLHNTQLHWYGGWPLGGPNVETRQVRVLERFVLLGVVVRHRDHHPIMVKCLLRRRLFGQTLALEGVLVGQVRRLDHAPLHRSGHLAALADIDALLEDRGVSDPELLQHQVHHGPRLDERRHAHVNIHGQPALHRPQRLRAPHPRLRQATDVAMASVDPLRREDEAAVFQNPPALAESGPVLEYHVKYLQGVLRSIHSGAALRGDECRDIRQLHQVAGGDDDQKRAHPALLHHLDKMI
mmetsp:Transcript_35558/g.59938  ORF Transcript_35558/g.59938 Transcript_35558/m.59938 type:complete len:492 (-) Transcript_35558:405-1880(-)